MSLFIQKNVCLRPASRISSWRRIALGTWKAPSDPSVYGTVDFPAEAALSYLQRIEAETGQKMSITHFVGKAVAETLRRHPEMNCLLRMGRFYPRETIDIFFQVAPDSTGEDLSGTVIRKADQKSAYEISVEMSQKVSKIKTKTDRSYSKMKKTMNQVPGLMAYRAVQLNAFLMYTMNRWSKLLGVPKDPFGSVMITNIGSLGLDSAYAPLVPCSRVPLVFALGSVEERPFIEKGQVVPKLSVRLCATFDHRIVDGVYAGHFVKTLKKIFNDPEKELGYHKKDEESPNLNSPMPLIEPRAESRF